MAQRLIVLGHVSGLFGVKGWIKVYSHTRPPENLLAFSEWSIGRQESWRPFRVLETRVQGKSLIARLASENGTPLPDRDAAIPLLDHDIAVARDAMPAPEPGQYYWFDLVGLAVVNREDVVLGEVKAMMETGANDVLVVQGERERLIPFVVGTFVDDVDLVSRKIRVDWDPDF